MEITRSSSQRSGWISLTGNMKVGKTVTACTYSEYCPAVLPAKGDKLIDCKDMLFWQFDKNGTLSLNDVGLDAPVLDLSAFDVLSLGEASYNSLLDDVIATTKDTVKDGVCCVVVDTISSFDTQWEAYYTEKFAGSRDTMQRYGHVLKQHRRFIQRLRTLPQQIILNGHLRALSLPTGPEEQKHNQEMKQKAQAMGGMQAPEFELEVTGKGGKLYKGNCDHNFSILCKSNGERILQLGQGNGIEGGSRLSNSLKARFGAYAPANLYKVLRETTQTEKE